MLGYRNDVPHEFHYVQFSAITDINDIIKNYPVDYILSIVHEPKIDGVVGVREVVLADGKQAFTAGDHYAWHPDISFRTFQNVIDCKTSKSVAEFRQDKEFMDGHQFYHVLAREKDISNDEF